jgi:hypothetical protein
MIKLLRAIGVLPDPEQEEQQDNSQTIRFGNLRNFAGWTVQIPNGSYYYLRFSVAAYIQGKYPWLSAIAETPEAARKAANKR